MIFEANSSELAVLRKARERWGEDHEQRMATEELSETITAICHFGRGRVPISSVIEELGDAIVCVAQMVYSEKIPLVAIERAIAESFGKLARKLEEDDMNYRLEP